jgi:hypothetical protein
LTAVRFQGSQLASKRSAPGLKDNDGRTLRASISPHGRPVPLRIGLFGPEPKSPLRVSLYPVEYGANVGNTIALARMIRKL